MDRKKFITTSSLTIGGFLITANQSYSQLQEEQYDQKVVKAFVGAGHNNLDKVKEILSEYPNIVNAAYDWKNGDFETAVGGAGHVGNREVAEYLISQGARINLFTLTMLGKNELVKEFIEEFPALLRAKGPHGFSMLHHAKVGKNEELMEFFQAQGLKKMKFSL
ncbi:hypothetical protein QQ008_05820 [Fulvivirgaceae bacterium BMA10]|uniref:Ankyrin repeat domain-containing protein n=1 Tax=Splendidivirga corallicola TaxID=3051826 RepID=A0ABT8KMV9_9BACT|nr:hypothetical protein [Fulvivirgaceae bacterium BMA10]